LLYQHIYLKKKYFYNFTKKVINLKVIHKTLIVTNVALKRICTYPHQVFFNFLKMLLLRDEILDMTLKNTQQFLIILNSRKFINILK